MGSLYFLYWLRYIEQEWDSKATGTTFKAISGSVLRTQEIPLPPLPEQHRLVAEIEKQLTRLDAGVAALRRAQANLRRYKAAVLKAACEGRLVPQDPADEPAAVLLQRILAERRQRWEAEQIARGKDPKKLKYKEPAPPDTSGLLELPEGWAWAICDQLISAIRSGSSAVPHNDPTGFPILRSSSVRPRSIDYRDIRFLTEEDSKNENNFLRDGDLLFTRLSGSIEYVGNCAMVRGIRFQYIQYPDRLFCVKPIVPDLGAYIEVCFSAPSVRKQIMALAKSTAGHQRISMGAITGQIIPLPPLAEQQRIVTEVERRLSVVEELEAAVEANLKRAGRLRQAILKRAFEGKLVPQDPSDEPATVLLERIRAAPGRRAGEAKSRGKATRKPKGERDKASGQQLRLL